ncbi:ABC transporter substrate-binding protein [Arthrobacter sp. KNU40]|uniref:ABC transporter substrate-binding protein n=1 Tax=Arthrobacter sp. KNU40 TaxID=3447965 RepID=UPI003F622AA0
MTIGIAAAATTLLSGCSGTVGLSAGTASSSAQVSVQLEYLLNTENAGFELADQNKRWEKEGLTVNLLPGGVNALSGAQALAGGTAQIAEVRTEDLLTAISQGQDLVVIGAVYQDTPAVILSGAEKPITNLCDLENKRLGVSAKVGIAIRNAMKVGGCNADSLAVIAGAVDPQALVDGQVDAVAGVAPNQQVALKKIGYKAHPLSYQELGLEDYAYLLTTTREFANSHHEQLVKFLGGLIQGTRDYVSDPQAGADAAVNTYGRDLGLDPATAILQARAWTGFLASDDTKSHGLLWVNTNRLAGPIYTSLKKFYGLESLPKPTTYVDLSALNDAYNTVGTGN